MAGEVAMGNGDFGPMVLPDHRGHPRTNSDLSDSRFVQTIRAPLSESPDQRRGETWPRSQPKQSARCVN
jgi:hypothetical protein